MPKNILVYNSLSKQKELFKSLVPGKVGLYVCGPTLYGDIHIGNLRTILSFDMIYRFLLSQGYEVRYVRNITDAGHLVDENGQEHDRVSVHAKLNNVEPMELVKKYTVNFHHMLRVYNALEPNIEPTATGHIMEQLDIIRTIIKNGYAYEKNGSVYFDIHAFIKDHPYGTLSGRNIDDLLQETRELDGQDEKKFFADFSLWKSVGPDALQSWNTEFGPGGPGWHIECTAMSTKYLGQTFDIHGGGMDLKFPHHEAEIAQSLAFCGKSPANYWLHANMLTVNGDKMSRSKGTSIHPLEIIQGTTNVFEKPYEAMVVRFLMLQTHYASTLDLTEKGLQAAEKGYLRLREAYLALLSMSLDDSSDSPSAHQTEIEEALKNAELAMCDDFNSAKALSYLFELIPLINKAKHEGLVLSKSDIEALKVGFKWMLEDIFGLTFEAPQSDSLSKVIEMLIEMRHRARADKNFALSDSIRDNLKTVGILLKDGKQGTEWSIA
ncbi:MAG: cysteine--tRNA ligase [Chitinophagales bacterium]|jgi:cysteinyl-tRNA synthetase|nr:cysteine--tRNA ligase [Chitinophagales bacterium]